MDKETKQMFELILAKLDGMDGRLDSMDGRLDSMNGRLDNMDGRLDRMDGRLDNMDGRLDSVEKRQDEMYLIQRSLEENIKVTRAEQEKMIYMLADVQGKVTKLTEEVDEHEEVIKQIRAIK
ncbi:hypothetical protein HBE96_21050 [Clostridium sp. P21]|uniref:t-SNARE coiled-coil homology domain-containing protein n=1 Tax=Clostridium muellerianum TaxID=2716538 RepID=A0A7Y0EKC9_9CLOT|nr:hypothetical protein [Clostridium muellerianum]NMM65075.1 hypothetical protein [Clostridium muellerianum]